MAKELKSVRYNVTLSKNYNSNTISKKIEAAAVSLDVYISHIGSYSRVKYPNSVHWHFKQHPIEKGCLDATFWEEGNEFWIVVRNYEPQWVKDKAPEMQRYLNSVL